MEIGYEEFKWNKYKHLENFWPFLSPKTDETVEIFSSSKITWNDSIWSPLKGTIFIQLQPLLVDKLELERNVVSNTQFHLYLHRDLHVLLSLHCSLLRTFEAVLQCSVAAVVHFSLFNWRLTRYALLIPALYRDFFHSQRVDKFKNIGLCCFSKVGILGTIQSYSDSKAERRASIALSSLAAFTASM